jgi:hypothetical protein
VKKFQKFLLETTSLGIKTCGESEFDIFEAKKRFPDSGKACVLKRKIAFRFNTQAFPESGKRFSVRKFQIQIPRMFLPLEGPFPEKIFANFFKCGPYSVVTKVHFVIFRARKNFLGPENFFD